MPIRKTRSKDARSERVPNVTRAGLEGAALRYLERFDCSVARLRNLLSERVSKAARAGAEAASAGPEVIEQLLERYQSSGLLDDRRFARNFSEHQRQRGTSRRMIEKKLLAHGIRPELSTEILTTASSSAELEAAQSFARRRRLGPHRKPELRDAYRRKDLQALARAGFSYGIASSVLGRSPSGDDEEF